MPLVTVPASALAKSVAPLTNSYHSCHRGESVHLTVPAGGLRGTSSAVLAAVCPQSLAAQGVALGDRLRRPAAMEEARC
jgi:hypothetical protein